MKLVYHSLTSLDSSEEYAGYADTLERHLDEVSREETEFELMGTTTTAGIGDYRATSSLAGSEVARNLMSLYRRDDVDGVAVGNTIDPGLQEARSILSIPVAGLFESAILAAHMIAERFMVIAANDNTASFLRDNLRAYGLDERVVGVYGPEMKIDEAARAFTDEDLRGEYAEEFGQLVKRGVDEGAGLVVPGGGLEYALLKETDIGNSLHGVPILDQIAVLVKMTEMLVDLYGMDAISTSRRCKYRTPPEDEIEEVLAAYGI